MNNQLTDERITDFIKGVGQLARLYPGTDNGNPYPPSEILSAFVELQKRRRADGANPVVYAYRACAEKRTKFDISGNWQFGNAVINADFPQILRPQCEDYEYLPLYAAPPAPVVPEECPDELLAFCEQVIDSRITANAKANELWNACRAAMLNQAPVKRQETAQ